MHLPPHAWLALVLLRLVSAQFVAYVHRDPFSEAAELHTLHTQHTQHTQHTLDQSALAPTPPTTPPLPNPILKFAAVSNRTTNSTKMQLKSTAAQPFRLYFNCTTSPPQVCQDAQRSAAAASVRIAQSLKIYKQIVIRVTLLSFCGSNLVNCPRRGLVGQASAASLIPAKKVDEDRFYQYPQSLVKQLNLDVEVRDDQFFELDVIAEFNSDAEFWFASSNKTIQKNQIDFEYAFIHEITHGLGFKSGWTQWSQFPELATFGISQPNFLAPYPDLTTPSQIRFLPLTIFDKFLTTPAGESISTLADSIGDFKPRDSLQKFVSEFQSSGQPFQSAQKLFEIQKLPRGLKFTSSQPPVSVMLTTGNGFVQGTSIMHVDSETYWLTSDFLMTPTVDNLKGLTLDEMIKRYSDTGQVYGKETIAMMQAMGWPTTQRPYQDTLILLSPRSWGVKVGVGWNIFWIFMMYFVCIDLI